MCSVCPSVNHPIMLPLSLRSWIREFNQNFHLVFHTEYNQLLNSLWQAVHPNYRLAISTYPLSQSRKFDTAFNILRQRRRFQFVFLRQSIFRLTRTGHGALTPDMLTAAQKKKERKVCTANTLYVRGAMMHNCLCVDICGLTVIREI